jgi:hypothetical protein
MRLILRVLGTWLFALAMVLVIIDGTRTLAASELVITSLGSSWQQMHPDSLAAFRAFLDSRLFGPLLDQVVTAILGFPAWAVIGVPGILLAYAGRARRRNTYLTHDGI